MRKLTLVLFTSILFAQTAAKEETKPLTAAMRTQAENFDLRRQNLALQTQLLYNEQNAWLLGVCKEVEFAQCSVDLQRNVVVKVQDKEK
jgi:hypothetical protein